MSDYATREYVDLKNKVIENQVVEIKDAVIRIEVAVKDNNQHLRDNDSELYKSLEVERNRNTSQEERIKNIESKHKDINRQIWVIVLAVVSTIIGVAFKLVRG